MLSCVSLTWILGSGAFAALGHPDGGDGHGLSIKLEVPWTTYAIGEKFVYSYTLKNASDKSVPVAIPVEKYGLGAITGGQAFLEAFLTGGRKVEDPAYEVQTAPWPPRTSPEDEEPQTWTWLPPGHQLTWNQNQLWSGHYGVGSYQSFESFRGHWLTGPNQWISSEPVKVKIVSVPQSEWTELFKVQWIATGYGGRLESGVYRVTIREKMYLFFDKRFRITEVKPDDQFEYSIDKDNTNLEITIKAASGSRKMYFHLAQGYTRDTPWPVGPASIFTPEPEPIPPAELAALRKAAFPEGFPETGDSRPERKPGSQTSVEAAESEKTPCGGFPAWTLAAVPALLVGMVVFMVRRLRGAAGRESPRS